LLLRGSDGDDIAVDWITGILDFGLSCLIVTDEANFVAICGSYVIDCSSGESIGAFGGRGDIADCFGSVIVCCLLLDDLDKVRPLYLGQDE
jgi:hypothetical protein